LSHLEVTRPAPEFLLASLTSRIT